MLATQIENSIFHSGRRFDKGEVDIPDKSQHSGTLNGGARSNVISEVDRLAPVTSGSRIANVVFCAALPCLASSP